MNAFKDGAWSERTRETTARREHLHSQLQFQKSLHHRRSPFLLVVALHLAFCSLKKGNLSQEFFWKTFICWKRDWQSQDRSSKTETKAVLDTQSWKWKYGLRDSQWESLAIASHFSIFFSPRNSFLWILFFNRACSHSFTWRFKEEEQEYL